LPRFVRRAGLSEHVGVVAQRCGLGCLDIAQPGEVIGSQLAERDALQAALAFALFLVGCFGGVRGDDARRCGVRAPLVKDVLRHAPAASAPTGPVALEPRRPDPALDLLAAVAELRFIKRAAVVLAHNEAGGRVRHEAA